MQNNTPPLPPQDTAAAPPYEDPLAKRPGATLPLAILAGYLFMSIVLAALFVFGIIFAALYRVDPGDMESLSGAMESIFKTFIGISSSALFLALNSALSILLFGLPVFLYYKRNPGMRHALRMNRLNPLTGVLVTLAGPVAALAASYLSVYWDIFLSNRDLLLQQQLSAAYMSPPQFAVMLLSVVVVAPLVEELFFRGLLLPSLEPCGRGRAIFLGSLFFVLIHLSIHGLPSHIFAAVALTLLALNTGTLFASMLFHLVYNLALVVLSNLPDSFLSHFLPTGRLTRPEALATLPTAALFFCLAVLLLYLAIRRGRRTQPDLPPPARRRLPIASRVLLGITLWAYLFMELFALAAIILPSL